MKVVEKNDGEMEYGKDGEKKEGGGFLMRKGQLCKMKKSVDSDDDDDAPTGLTEDDLQKGLDALDAYVEGTDDESRKDTLLKKALDNELDGEEQAELFNLMGGVAEGEGDAGDDLEKSSRSITDSATVADAFEVSDFLKDLTEGLVKSIDQLESRIEAMDRRNQDFGLLLVKSMSLTGRATKAMSQRLGVIASQPARGPKSRLTGAQPLNKSIGGDDGDGGGGDGDQLQSRQVFQALDSMMQKSMAEDRQGVSLSGHDLALATSKFEHQRTIAPELLAEVRAELGLK